MSVLLMLMWIGGVSAVVLGIGYGAAVWMRRRAQAVKAAMQALVGFVQIFGKNPRFADRGDETDVARPARQHVHVNMAGDACAGALADVHSDVQPLGFVFGLQVPGGLGGQVEHFVTRLRAGLVQLRYVRIRNHHQVAGGIGV